MAMKTHYATSGIDVLRLTGAFTAIFGLAVGLLVVYVIPGACSFLGGLEVLFLAFLFLAGVLALITGQALVWRKKK